MLITAIVGLIVVERRRSDRTTLESLEPAVIAQRVGDAAGLIQPEITDLQNRVGRLEALLMGSVWDWRNCVIRSRKTAQTAPQVAHCEIRREGRAYFRGADPRTGDRAGLPGARRGLHSADRQ
jgi:hypothetical protein